MLTYRIATETDDLTTGLPDAVALIPWNRDQLLVALDGDTVIGGALFWDAGHPSIMLDFIYVEPTTRGKSAASGLIAALEDHARSLGKVALCGYVSDPAYMEIVKHWGGKAYPQTFSFVLKPLCQT